jgi:hypothetical protein
LYREAVRLAADGQLQAEALLALAGAQQLAGERDDARGNAERALAAARRAGYRWVEGLALTVLARVGLTDDAVAEAIRNARDASLIHAECGARVDQARSLMVLAEAEGRMGDTVAAATHRSLADEIFADLG